MTWTGRKSLNRFMRSRGLALSTVLALFMGWILLAGFLLWQVKVREEFSSLGKLDLPVEPGASAESAPKQIRLRLFQGPSWDALASLRPGEEVQVRIEGQKGHEISFSAHMV